MTRAFPQDLHLMAKSCPNCSSTRVQGAVFSRVVNLVSTSSQLLSFVAAVRMMDDNETVCACLESEVIASATSHLKGTRTVTWDRVRVATTSDENFTRLVSLVENGIPESRLEVPPKLREFHQYRDDLHTVDGVILYKGRIVMPPSLRDEVLQSLHSAHQGVSGVWHGGPG